MSSWQLISMIYLIPIKNLPSTKRGVPTLYQQMPSFICMPPVNPNVFVFNRYYITGSIKLNPSFNSTILFIDIFISPKLFPLESRAQLITHSAIVVFNYFSLEGQPIDHTTVDWYDLFSDFQATELRGQIDENEKLYREILEQWQNGFLSDSDYQAASARNRAENQRLRTLFESVSFHHTSVMLSFNYHQMRYYG